MITLNILWHMHQPDYRHPADGRYILPWVRLHAVKGYTDLLAVLARRESLASTVNFSGILLEQLHEYSNSDVNDVFARLCLKRVSDLDSEERQFILRHFFSSNQQTMVRPHYRFRELKSRRDNLIQLEGIEKAAEVFSDQEYADLMVWFNLAWIGFTGARRPDVIELIARGRDFGLEHRRQVLDIHLEMVRDVLAGYRRLAETTANEISFTPHHHPILPLLIDLAGMGSHNPADRLPQYSYPDDANEQIRRGIGWYERCFGRSPRGVWPAEGSVSDDALNLFAAAGITWACTDQQNLPECVQGPYSHLTPYGWRSNGSGLHVFFRDTRLADNIGFEYSGWQSRMAGNHLVEMAVALGGRTLTKDPVITVALDGENPWENYPDGGEGFLEALADGIEVSSEICCRTPQMILEGTDFPEIDAVSAGSWIGGNFDIWSRHPETRVAWRRLARARQDLIDVAKGEVLDHLLTAEGSDWFWWFGDDFATGQARQFDELFRGHLIAAYRAAGRPVPDELFAPIIAEREQETAGEVMELIEPELDGRVTDFYEWRGAVRLDSTYGQGAMAKRNSDGITELWYGFSEDALYLRIEMAPELLTELHGQGAGITVRLNQDEANLEEAWKLPEGGDSPVGCLVIDRIIECRIDLDQTVLVRDKLAFLQVRLETADGRVFGFPETGRIPLRIISGDFAVRHWTV